MNGIRVMTELDLPAVERIERASFPVPWSPVSLLASCRDDVAFVLEEEGGVRGYLFAKIAADQAEILTLAVDPCSRRRGAGTALLTHFLKIVRERLVSRVFLEVRLSNGIARSLYEKAGFREWDVRKRYYSNGEDALVLALNLV